MKANWYYRQETWMVTALLAGVILAALTTPAEAQNVQAFVTWAIGPTALGGLIALGVALVGLLLMFGQHTFTGIAFLVLGAICVANATQIGGFFGGGG